MCLPSLFVTSSRTKTPDSSDLLNDIQGRQQLVYLFEDEWFVNPKKHFGTIFDKVSLPIKNKDGNYCKIKCSIIVKLIVFLM